MNDVIKMLIESINEIDEQYFQQTRGVLVDNEILDLEEYNTSESTIVTQLYLKLFPRLRQSGLITNRRLDVNSTKRIIFDQYNVNQNYEHSYNKVFNQKFYNEINRVPDLVLHQSSLDMAIENQILLCEVKCTENLNQNQFNRDLFKINLYHQELNFQNSCYIILNLEPQVIKDMYENYKTNNIFISNRKNKFFIIKPAYNRDVQIINF